MDTLNIISSTFFLQISLSLSESNQEETSLQSERSNPTETHNTHAQHFGAALSIRPDLPQQESARVCQPMHHSSLTRRSRLTRLLDLTDPHFILPGWRQILEVKLHYLMLISLICSETALTWME